MAGWRALLAARRARWLLLAAVLAALGALALYQHNSRVTARPALWRISMGDRHAWLFGTIHAVPVGARWLSPTIAKAAGESDALMLEVTGLAQEQRDRAVFESLGRTPGLPSLATRLDPPDRARLAALVRATPDGLAGIDGYEDWAAALLIGAATSGLSSAEAGEARFSNIFGDAGKPVLGLETIPDQLSLFDRLPPADQHTLLTQAVREGADAPRLYRALYESWANGDRAGLERQYLAPLAATPILRAILLDDRNARWARDLDQRLRHDHRVLFVAVGAGHLLGSASLQARLAAFGWKIERVQ